MDVLFQRFQEIRQKMGQNVVPKFVYYSILSSAIHVILAEKGRILGMQQCV